MLILLFLDLRELFRPFDESLDCSLGFFLQAHEHEVAGFKFVIVVVFVLKIRVGVFDFLLFNDVSEVLQQDVLLQSLKTICGRVTDLELLATLSNQVIQAVHLVDFLDLCDVLFIPV